MRFSGAPKSETIQFRVTPAEREYLAGRAEQLGSTVAGVLRMAIDAWLQSQRESAAPSKRRPSRSKARTR